MSKFTHRSVEFVKPDAKKIKPYQEYPRNRWLSDEELQNLISTLDGYRNQNVSNIIRLILFTGSKCNEVLNATWDQFDLEQGVWMKSTQTTKRKRMGYFPLSTQVLEILRQMKTHSNSLFLFPGKVSNQPIQGITKAWATIRNQAELQDCRINDLRHTYATHLLSSGVSISMIGRLLGHAQFSNSPLSNYHMDAPLRQAAELFGNKMNKLFSQLVR